MPRNTWKYAYVSLAIDKDSLLYSELMKDAVTSGLPLSDVILMCLADHIRKRVTVELSTVAEQSHTIVHSTEKDTTLPDSTFRESEKVDVIEEYTPNRAKKLALEAISAFDEF